MCSSIFGPIMDNFHQQGDLTDIVRASSVGGAAAAAYGSNTSSEAPFNSDWQFSDAINFSSVLEDPIRGGSSSFFGDPFSNMRDPFLNELHLPPAASYFNNSAAGIIATSSASVVFGDSGSGSGGGSISTSNVLPQNILEDQDMRSRPVCNNSITSNIFSNMIQISPGASLPVSPRDSAAAVRGGSPRRIKPCAVVSGNMINANSSKDCSLVDNTGGVQISSPRNPGLKRRKSQAKKVVCIPAPAAANSRPSGEVVPSDLWAWRKYGQKPIKGSPYPRGYYRCSSSKGCSARKQVERSRTDPNMLVITYTSEHNHPWPTQRNALAGSTRSQPSKKNSSETSNSQPPPQKGPTTKPKEEQQQQQQQREMSNNSEGNNLSPLLASNSVKEEMEDIEKQLEIENLDDGEFSDGMPYKPSMLEDGNYQSEDFFAELGEIEADPLDLIFTSQGFNEPRESKASLDPFHLFDWSGDTTTDITTSFDHQEPASKRGL